ncbi:MAG: Rieske 2Fe-2S domain-containing protein [Actinomycetota bacterium]|nr:Rieske 2Fe-2S domain-containing protein [Actinomycetota bacterium]
MTGPHRPPFPVGWFAVADAEEVPDRELVPLAAFGQYLAVGRTPAGGAAVVHATCPHLGADLAVGGRIDDDQVVCPLHGWCFSHSGDCTSAGRGPVPDAVKLRVWPAAVVDGIVWAFHGRSGEQPGGLPPGSGGSSVRAAIEVSGHPEDVLAGLLVDLGAARGGTGEDGVWQGDGPSRPRVVGPGTLVAAGGGWFHVTPVDGFKVAVRTSGVAAPEPRSESDRTVLSGFRDWYRRFDRPSVPARRPVRSGPSGRRRRERA